MRTEAPPRSRVDRRSDARPQSLGEQRNGRLQGNLVQATADDPRRNGEIARADIKHRCVGAPVERRRRRGLQLEWRLKAVERTGQLRNERNGTLGPAMEVDTREH